MRSLSIFALLVSAASFANAGTITFNVSFGPTFSGALQSINVDHSAALTGLTVTGATLNLTSLTLNSSASVTNNDPNNSTTATFVVNPYAVTISNLSGFSNFIANGTNRNETQGPVAAAGGVANFANVADNFNNNFGATDATYLDGIWSFATQKAATTSADTANGNFSSTVSTSYSGVLSVTYTYQDQQTGTPEPSTLALVGGVLVLAGLRKFRS